VTIPDACKRFEEVIAHPNVFGIAMKVDHELVRRFIVCYEETRDIRLGVFFGRKE
jgi:hypothetical protein